MVSQIAAILCVLVILSFFLLDRDRSIRTSAALWIPSAWVLIAASRMVSEWMGPDPGIENAQQYIDGSPLDRAVLAVLLFLGFIVLLSRMKRVVALLRMNGPILLFFGYCAVSALWSDYPDVAFKRWVKALGDLVVVLIILTDKDRVAAIKRVLARVGFLLIPLSVLFIEFYPSLGQVYSPEDAVTTYTGVTLYKNTLGRLCLVIGLASVWRLVYAYKDNFHRSRRLIVHGAMMAMVLWLLVMANSATSLASLLLGSALIVVVSLPGRERTGWVHFIVGSVAVLALAVIVLPEAFAYIVSVLGRDTTLTDRTKLWTVLLNMNTNPWFGTGFASFWLGNRLDKLWSLFVWQPNEAHNGYIGVFLDLGWVGLSMLAVLLVTGYRNVVAAFRLDPEAGSLRLGFIVVAIVYNFTEEAFRMMIPVWIFLLWAVMAVPQRSPREYLISNEALEPDHFEEALPVVRT